jgi:hypothetical protein
LKNAERSGVAIPGHASAAMKWGPMSWLINGRPISGQESREILLLGCCICRSGLTMEAPERADPPRGGFLRFVKARLTVLLLPGYFENILDLVALVWSGDCC